MAVLSDLLSWGRSVPTNHLPMLRVLRELPSEAFSVRVASREAMNLLQQALQSQAPVLVDVVSTFLAEGGRGCESQGVGRCFVCSH